MNTVCVDHFDQPVHDQLNYSSNVNRIQYRNSLEKVVKQVWVLWKLMQWKVYFTEGHTWNVSGIFIWFGYKVKQAMPVNI
jgi:hypothetical protein